MLCNSKVACDILEVFHLINDSSVLCDYRYDSDLVLFFYEKNNFKIDRPGKSEGSKLSKDSINIEFCASQLIDLMM